MASSPRIDELQKKFDENPRRYFAPLANEYRKIGDLDQAIFICQEYLPQQPGHMSGHIVFGQALFEAQRFDEAKAVFETALTLDPENLIALRHLGDIARGLGDPATARTWYQRVLEADPRNEEIAAALASLPEDQPAPSAAGGPEAVESAPAALAATAEPVIDVPLETEPTESPLADFAGIVDEIRTEAATGAPEVPAADLTVPHASTDSEALDVDTIDFSFGAAAATPARSPEPAAPPAEPKAQVSAPADWALELDSAAASPTPASAASPTAGGASAAATTGHPPVTALDGLEPAEHEAPADASAFAPLEGLDVLEGSFMAPPPAEPPAAPPPAPAVPSAPAATAASPAPGTLPDLDDDLDALFAEAAPSPKSAPAAPAAPASAPATEPESPARAATAPVIGQAAAAKNLSPLPPEPPARTPAWGMPDLEVPGWEVAAPPPPPTPPIPTPAVPSRPSAELPSAPRASERAREPEAVEESAASAPAPFVTETMAELYVQQGHREAAVGIYRQLIAERPADQSLRVRLAELESLSAAIDSGPSEEAPEAETTTIRDFLAALAACRPRGADVAAPDAAGHGGDNGSAGSHPAVAAAPADDSAPLEPSAAPLEGLPVLEDTWSGETGAESASAVESSAVAESSPAAAEVPAAPAQVELPAAAFPRRRDSGSVGGSLDALFAGADAANAGGAPERPRAPVRERPSAPSAPQPDMSAMGGEPARPAANELSLDVVFREPTPSASHDAAGFSFDQFFSQAANERRQSHATPEQAGAPQQGAGADDIEQFNAWLEGLKKS